MKKYPSLDSNEIEKHLEQLREFVSSMPVLLEMKKKDFSAYLADEMNISDESISRLIIKNPKSIPLSWAKISNNLSPTNIELLKNGLEPAIEKYINDPSQDIQNRNTVKQNWIHYKKLILSVLNIQCDFITGLINLSALEQTFGSDEYLEKGAFTYFINTDWTEFNFENVENTRKLLILTRKYLLRNIDIDRHTLSDEEIEGILNIAEKMSKVDLQEIHLPF